jgi:phage gpG-like protein
VEQTINLEELFGTSFKRKKDLREAIAERAIEIIKDRTQSNVGMKFDASGRGRPVDFVPYSKKYIDSLEFDAWGKSAKDVNMTLKGDMLELMDIKRQSGDSITIGWTSSLENKKAYAHTVGKEGDSKVNVPSRPFFGLTKSELKSLVKEFEDEVDDGQD